MGAQRGIAEVNRTRLFHAAKAHGLAEARSIWLSGAAFAPASGRPDLARRVQQLVSAYSGWHWLNPNPVKQAAVPAVERLREVRTPVLLIIGELNPPDYHQVGDLLEKELPNVRRILMRNAGHLLRPGLPGRGLLR